jgi:hypothetical protein
MPSCEGSEGFLRVSKGLVYQRSSAQISGKKLALTQVGANRIQVGANDIQVGENALQVGANEA